MSEYQTVQVRLVAELALVEVQLKKIVSGPQLELFEKELDSLFDEQKLRNFLFDFRKVAFISSATLNLLLDLRKRTREIGGEIRFVNIISDLGDAFGGDLFDSGPGGGSPVPKPTVGPKDGLNAAKGWGDEED